MSPSKKTQRDEEFFIMDSSMIHIGKLSYLQREGRKPDTKTPLSCNSGRSSFQFFMMEACMNKIFRSLDVLALRLVGLMGCDFESRTVGNV